MPAKAVLFDLDNTLTHRAQSIERYAQRFLSDYADVLRRDTSPKEIAAIIAAVDNGGYLPAESPYASIRDAVGWALVEALQWRSPMTAKDLTGHWMNYFPSTSVAMPGAEKLLKELALEGTALGVISNGAEHSRRRTVEALPFGSEIKVVISSEACGYSKPSSEIFHAGADALGYPAEQCVFVGDHPQNDYQGAKTSGMQAVWLEGFHDWPSDFAPATHSIRSLNELLPLLKQNSP
ncbi:MAG: HAD family hydrolase [Ectopseudomonas guguanensis]|uniref:HAD family hydrolase n=1 Tax=Ectopseudomonas guguanensis TaxID=1198456 RepID=UPI00391D2840